MTDQVPEVELPKLCPKCGTKTIFGFGLAGGGMGPYVVCDGPLGQGECDFFLKKTSLQEGSMQGLDVNIRNERSVYSTVLADPPWPESGGGKVKRGADRHYPLMRIDDIAKLPVRDIARPDAHLYLWATNNHLPGALDVMRAWGFRYVTNICWGKVSATGVVQQGLGQYFRGAHELLLFGVRGKVPYRTLPDGKRAQHPTLVLAPRGEHSRKPDVFHDIIEKVSPGPYVELFARRARPGWAVWGNQAPNPVVLEPPPT